MRCKMCGRKLKDPASIDKGRGPICQGKRAIGSWQMELNFYPKIDRSAILLEQYRTAMRLIKGE